MYVCKSSSISACNVLLEGDAIEKGYSPIKVHSPTTPRHHPSRCEIGSI